MPMSGKQIIKLLQKESWKLIRVIGSHYRFEKNDKKVTVLCMQIKV